MRFLKRLLRHGHSKKKSAANLHYYDDPEADPHYTYPPEYPPAPGDRPRTAPSSTPSRNPFHHHDEPPPLPSSYGSYNPGHRGSVSAAARFPTEVLVCIFSYICPHALDETYASAEDTTTEGGCMLCDMRDLANLGLVSRHWHAASTSVLYQCVRLDSVHYCGLEDELLTRRKRGSFFQRQKASPMEVPEQRLRALYRTLQESEAAAERVRYIKMPYMTRETCKQDLAALVSLTPNLRYVDLPEGVYSDDATCASLKAALYARCPDLRKMCWVTGSEKNFVDLWADPPWRALEVMHLSNMRVENADLVHVISSLPDLRELKLSALPWISDAIFDGHGSAVGIFPALRRLEIVEIPTFTTVGIRTYLSRSVVAATLRELVIAETPTIPPRDVPFLLSLATNLKTFSYRCAVSRALDYTQLPPISSSSLRTLRWEITDDGAAKSLAKPSPSHYAYLASSLLSSSLPVLSDLYVRDPTFHDRMSKEHAAAGPFANPWTQHLTVYSKGAEHLDWTKHLITPSDRSSLTPNPRGAPGAPVIRPVWEMPRNSLVADPGVMNGFLAAAAAGAIGTEFQDDVLTPPKPGFAGGMSLPVPGGGGGGGNRPRSWVPSSKGAKTTSMSIGLAERPHSSHSVNTAFGLVPPSPGFAKREKRSSRQDLWR